MRRFYSNTGLERLSCGLLPVKAMIQLHIEEVSPKGMDDRSQAPANTVCNLNGRCPLDDLDRIFAFDEEMSDIYTCGKEEKDDLAASQHVDSPQDRKLPHASCEIPLTLSDIFFIDA